MNTRIKRAASSLFYERKNRQAADGKKSAPFAIDKRCVLGSRVKRLQANTPTSRRMNAAKNTVNAETAVVQTTS